MLKTNRVIHNQRLMWYDFHPRGLVYSWRFPSTWIFFTDLLKHTKYLESHLFEKAKKHCIITW